MVNTASRSPLVSICVPTFNGERYLGAALRSAAQQTYRPIEIVVSDDQSTDGTVEIARRICAECSVPSTIVTHVRDTLAGNWNHTVRHAHGKYIKFLFQDDILDPNCLEEMVRVAESDDEIGMVFSRRTIQVEASAQAIDDCDKFTSFISDVHAGWSALDAVQPGRKMLEDPDLFKPPINKIGEPSNVLIRRDVLDEVGAFDGNLKQVLDVDMWWRLLAVCKVAFVDAELSRFRVHVEQESVRNLASGESSADMKRFCKKLRESPIYRCLCTRTLASTFRDESGPHTI